MVPVGLVAVGQSAGSPQGRQGTRDRVGLPRTTRLYDRRQKKIDVERGRADQRNEIKLAITLYPRVRMY